MPSLASCDYYNNLTESNSTPVTPTLQRWSKCFLHELWMSKELPASHDLGLFFWKLQFHVPEVKLLSSVVHYKWTLWFKTDSWWMGESPLLSPLASEPKKNHFFSALFYYASGYLECPHSLTDRNLWHSSFFPRYSLNVGLWIGDPPLDAMVLLWSFCANRKSSMVLLKTKCHQRDIIINKLCNRKPYEQVDAEPSQLGGQWKHWQLRRERKKIKTDYFCIELQTLLLTVSSLLHFSWPHQPSMCSCIMFHSKMLPDISSQTSLRTLKGKKGFYQRFHIMIDLQPICSVPEE